VRNALPASGQPETGFKPALLIKQKEFYMGYVNDTQMSKFIFPNEFSFSAGTWTPTVASDVVSMLRTQADASFTAIVPIKLPSNTAALKGAYLKSIDIYYKIGTAAADDFATVDLNKEVLGADDTAITAAAQTITLDVGHDLAAERLAVDTDHVMTITLTTPVWINNGDAFWIEMIVDCAATTDFAFFGARANYTLRV
jgi:hypothetical protein